MKKPHDRIKVVVAPLDASALLDRIQVVSKRAEELAAETDKSQSVIRDLRESMEKGEAAVAAAFDKLEAVKEENLRKHVEREFEKRWTTAIAPSALPAPTSGD